MEEVEFYQSTLSTIPNTIVKIFRFTKPFAVKIYKGKTQQVLRMIEMKMKSRCELIAKLNGEPEFPEKIVVRLAKDAQMRPYLHIQSPYMTIAHLPINEFSKLKKAMGPLINGLLKGDNFFFYSHDNIFYDEASISLVAFNFASNTTLPFIYTRSSLSKQQFEEVYELIDPKMFDREPNDRMTYKLKFRALGVAIINFILEKRLSLLLQTDKLNNEISFEEAKVVLAQSSERFKQILGHPHFRKKVEVAQNSDKVNYYYFLKRVFVDDCEGLTWTQAISLLTFQLKPQQESNVFAKVAEKMFQNELPENKRLYEQLGLSEVSERQLYLLVKARINVGSLIHFKNIDDYLNNANNWSLDKQQICKSLINVLTGYRSSSKVIEHQDVSAEEQQEFAASFKNSYAEFRQAFGMIEHSMSMKSIRIQSHEIKFLTNYERILKQYQRL